MAGIVSYFLLLRDQATYKRIFEEIEGKKSNPSFPLGKKKFVLILTHFWSCLSWIPWWVMIYMSLDGVIFVFVGEKWPNLSFLGRTHTLVPVPKVGTGTHSIEGKWYRYQKLGYR